MATVRARLVRLAPAFLVVCAVVLLVAGLVEAAAKVHVHVKLVPSPDGAFLVGRPAVVVRAPIRITVAFFKAGVRHFRIVGLKAGGKVHVKATPFKLHVKVPGMHLKIGPGGPGFKGKGKHKIKFK